jgi:hypothetical protein
MTVVKHKIVIVIFTLHFLSLGTPKNRAEVGPSSVFPIKSRVSAALQLSFGTFSEFPKMARHRDDVDPWES